MDSKIKVPFNDLYLQHQSLQPHLSSAIDRVIKESKFVRGPDVEFFEEAFADINDSKFCVSCANGTDSLYIAMMALGVGVGDEVIVPAMSWISTSETVSQTGAKVVFCDIDPKTYVIDIEDLKRKITSRSVGIIPVHLYGHPADMPSVMKVADSRKLWVIEDCAQAHLAEVQGKKVGTFGVAGSFSFYPGKNLGAMGDAGALITNDATLSKRMSMFARHGGLIKGDHQIEGINSRLDGIQAAILNLKLNKLSSWTQRRRDIARHYLDGLAGEPLMLPVVAQYATPAWHLFVVRTAHRDRLRAYLREKGVQTVINYPRALPFLPCYNSLAAKESDFPNSYELSQTCLSLPIFPEITDRQVDYCIDQVKRFFSSVE